MARGRSSAVTICHVRGSRAVDGGIDGHLHLVRGGRWLAGGGVDRKVADEEQGPALSDAVAEPRHQLADRTGHVDVETAD